MYLDFFPPFLQNLKEFKLLCEIDDIDYNVRKKIVQNLYLDQFILTATLRGIRRWEKIMNIPSNETESLEQRRNRLFIKYNQQPPYTLRTIQKKLDLFCQGAENYELEIDTKAEEIRLTLQEQIWTLSKDIWTFLEDATPLNFIFLTDYTFNLPKRPQVGTGVEINCTIYPRFKHAEPLLFDYSWSFDYTYYFSQPKMTKDDVIYPCGIYVESVVQAAPKISLNTDQTYSVKTHVKHNAALAMFSTRQNKITINADITARGTFNVIDKLDIQINHHAKINIMDKFQNKSNLTAKSIFNNIRKFDGKYKFDGTIKANSYKKEVDL